jgi:plasmid replication initiation protein
MKNKQENALIVKANQIIEASYHLTLQEQRIVLYMASQIDKNDEDFKPIKIGVSDFSLLINAKGHDYYEQIKKLTDSLRKRDLVIKDNNSILRMGWLSSSEYFYNKGYIELCFDPKLKPYLLQLKERFTKYYLKDVIQMRHSYSIRLYELLKQYEPIGHRYFDLDELRYVLGIKPDEYKLYADFKARVIEPAKAEFNEKCSKKELDLTFDYTPKKQSRKVIGLHFDIKKHLVEMLLPVFQADVHQETTGDELLNMLLEMKVSKKQADSLIKSYASDVIERNIKLTQKRADNEELQNIAAFLTSAIKNDYAKDYNPAAPDMLQLRTEAKKCWAGCNGNCKARWSRDNKTTACYYCPKFIDNRKSHKAKSTIAKS